MPLALIVTILARHVDRSAQQSRHPHGGRFRWGRQPAAKRLPATLIIAKGHDRRRRVEARCLFVAAGSAGCRPAAAPT
jgi:hypothetical protein